MRIVQIPLWWTVGFGLAAYIASIDGDLAALITFAAVFGIVFGGGMQAIEATPRQRPPAKRKSRRPIAEVLRLTAIAGSD